MRTFIINVSEKNANTNDRMGAPSTLWARKGRFFDMVQQSNEVEDLELAMAS